MMDSSLYKDVTTSRGLRYHYLFSPSVRSKPTLVFLHGFPSTSYDWRHQVSFFKEEGYGLIVPDLLGYGGTDKPKNPTSYKQSAMTADIIDIMNAENVHKAIAIGHDWGSLLCSRLASYYPGRFLGFGFLAVSYIGPNPTFKIEDHLALTKKLVGYEAFAYWLFFSEDGADKIIEEHIDSFCSILHPRDPKIWITDLAPRDTLKAYILSDKIGPLPTYLTKAEKQSLKQTLLAGGLAAPLNYYKCAVSGIYTEDDKSTSSYVPKKNYALHHPVFFGGATQDYVCISAIGKAETTKFCKNVTIKEFDTNHWLQLAAPDEVNRELLAWIKTINT